MALPVIPPFCRAGVLARIERSSLHTLPLIMRPITSRDIGSYPYAGTAYANPHASGLNSGLTLTYDNNVPCSFLTEPMSIISILPSSANLADHSGVCMFETVGRVAPEH